MKCSRALARVHEVEIISCDSGFTGIGAIGSWTFLPALQKHLSLSGHRVYLNGGGGDCRSSAGVNDAGLDEHDAESVWHSHDEKIFRAENDRPFSGDRWHLFWKIVRSYSASPRFDVTHHNR